MADKSYDAVIIGGGQHGLIVGNYLARNGMSVGIFERRYEMGGVRDGRTPHAGVDHEYPRHIYTVFYGPGL